MLYPTRILLATDGSPESRRAAETAVELAVGTGSELHVEHAISTAPRRWTGPSREPTTVRAIPSRRSSG